MLSPSSEELERFHKLHRGKSELQALETSLGRPSMHRGSDTFLTARRQKLCNISRESAKFRRNSLYCKWTSQTTQEAYKFALASDPLSTLKRLGCNKLGYRCGSFFFSRATRACKT